LGQAAQSIQVPRALPRRTAAPPGKDGDVVGCASTQSTAPEEPPPPWDVVFYVDRNTFCGETHVQLLVQAMRTSTAD